MADIYKGLLAQVELIEEFYSLSLKEHAKLFKIKIYLREVINLYERKK